MLSYFISNTFCRRIRNLSRGHQRYQASFSWRCLLSSIYWPQGWGGIFTLACIVQGMCTHPIKFPVLSVESRRALACRKFYKCVLTSCDALLLSKVRHINRRLGQFAGTYNGIDWLSSCFLLHAPQTRLWNRILHDTYSPSTMKTSTDRGSNLWSETGLHNLSCLCGKSDDQKSG